MQDQVVEAETLDVENAELQTIAGECGVGRRSWVRANGQVLRVRYKSSVCVSRPRVHLGGLQATPIDALAPDVLTFLRPSRYCQSDRFETFAASKFGQLAGGEKVMAISDLIASEMEYAPGQSDTSTTLVETFAKKKGVCRDYAHVLCGLARACHIPARYVSAYGVSVDPPDFHAVAEVWLDNRWQLVDPSGMCSSDELVIIGIGRDAGDVPFMETPDEARFLDQRVQVNGEN
jgi:transglutaminase-like putative cysteine protease